MCCLLGVRKINVTKETTASPSAKLSILGLTESFAFGDQFSVVTWISDQMHIANETSFAFRKRRERIDWRKLAAVDIDKVAQDVDVQLLQENTSNVTFCDIEAEMGPNVSDPNFIKLFRLAQLIIEYLMDCLSSALVSLEKQLLDKAKHVDELKEKLQKFKMKHKAVEENQLYIVDGNGDQHKCSFCTKVFLTEHFLQLHLERRHHEHAGRNAEFVDPGVVKALESQLAELQARLAMTESAFQNEKASYQAIVFKETTENTQREAELRKEMERWKEEQLLIHAKDLENVREMFSSELKVINDKYLNAEKLLKELSQKSEPKSNLGLLIDEEEINLELAKRQKAELLQIKEQLDLQLAEVRKGVQLQLKEQERDWRAKLHKLEQTHSNEISKLVQSFSRRLGDTATDEQLQLALESRLNKQIEKLEVLSRKQQLKIDYQEKKLKELNKPFMIHSTPNIQHKSLSDLHLTGEASNDQLLHSNDDIPTLPKLKASFKRNPIIVQGMRQELMDLLDQKLETIGISKGAVRVKDTILSNKLATQESERKKMKKYNSLMSIREQLHNKVEQLAKRKLKQKNTTKSTPSLSKKSFKSVFGDMAEKLKSARVHSREMTSTPIYNSPLKITDDNNKVLSKTNEWNGFTESDKAEKDEGEENSYEEDSDDIITSKKRAEDLESELKLKAHTLSNTLFQWESDVDSQSEDSDTDNLDSTHHVSKQFEGKVSPKPTTRGIPVRTFSVPELASSLELQFDSRKAKPPGGVDLMPAMTVPHDFSKDGDVKHNSDMHNGLPSSVAYTLNESAKTKQSLVSKIETDNSNTAATSIWGSSVSNQGINKIPDITSKPTSSLVSVSSWDSEDTISEIS